MPVAVRWWINWESLRIPKTKLNSRHLSTPGSTCPHALLLPEGPYEDFPSILYCQTPFVTAVKID